MSKKQEKILKILQYIEIIGYGGTLLMHNVQNSTKIGYYQTKRVSHIQMMKLRNNIANIRYR